MTGLRLEITDGVSGVKNNCIELIFVDGAQKQWLATISENGGFQIYQKVGAAFSRDQQF